MLTIIPFITGMIAVGCFIMATFSYFRNNKDSTKLNPSQMFEKIVQNNPYKCKCGIISRKYQLQGDEQTVCPHCEYDMRTNTFLSNLETVLSENGIYYEHQVVDDREFPFAPKLTNGEFLEWWNHKEEIKRIEKEKNDLIETDKELEAYTNLQMKKLEEYQRKAEEIKKELQLQE